MAAQSSDKRLHLTLLAIGLGVLIWSAINPHDWLMWALEVFPAVIGVAILLITYKRFQFSNLAYVLVLVHAIILIVGGHWTYARMPLFEWLRETFEWQRNYYDRVGHVAQGFIPAILVREFLLRTSTIRTGKWVTTIVISMCLAISAVYEFIEWWVALILGEGADQFLATQGDQWDTQWDMFLATCSAAAALLMLSRLHDRSMKKLADSSSR